MQNSVNKIAILRARQQDAEALGTQFQPVYALYNDKRRIVTLKEMKSSDRVIYIPYSAVSLKQETIELIKLIKNISPNTIYINSLWHLLTIGLLIKIPSICITKPTLIATSHNSKVWRSTIKRLLIAILLNSLADGVLTLAKFQEHWLIKYGVSALKIRTISNPVDIDLFSPNVGEERTNLEDSPVLINIADLRPVKSQDTLIKAIRLVKDRFPKIKLILMGGQFSDTKYGCYLRDLIVDYGVETNVINIGDIEHQQIPRLLRSSDISLISSLSEVCPYAVLESLAAGKVTIATAVGGIPDLIKNEFNGFLIEPGDIKGFADCILRVLNDQSLKVYIEKNARKSAVSNYSYQIIGEKHREFISALFAQQ